MNLLSKEIIVVGVGGAVGSVGRLLLSRFVQKIFPYEQLPWGIIACNILGCFLIGILFGVFEMKMMLSPLWRAGLVIGVLGGFTTFSSFSVDTFNLLHKGAFELAFSNVIISLICCLYATAVGYWLVRVAI